MTLHNSERVIIVYSMVYLAQMEVEEWSGSLCQDVFVFSTTLRCIPAGNVLLSGAGNLREDARP